MDRSLDELERLADTAGAEVVGRVTQKLTAFNPSTLIGTGKLIEIAEMVETHAIELVIFDEELTGSQIKKIEQHLPEVKIIDRSMLILDIFAQHAQTAEARLMVQIAQLEYMMPRLTRLWTHFSRQEGGHSIATRGPGETQLETDRRTIKRQLVELKSKLERIEKSREQQAVQRNAKFQIAVAGYTNAGKSTLVNLLTSADVMIADQLFATLDSTTRKLWLSAERSAIISDTVGFIRKLPHHLIASFRSTLGVVAQSDLVLHVADASDPSLEEQIAVTDEVLQSLLSPSTAQLLVLNKSDRLSPGRRESLLVRHPHAILISAKKSEGIDELREKLEEQALQWEKERLLAVEKEKKRGAKDPLPLRINSLLWSVEEHVDCAKDSFHVGD